MNREELRTFSVKRRHTDNLDIFIGPEYHRLRQGMECRKRQKLQKGPKGLPTTCLTNDHTDMNLELFNHRVRLELEQRKQRICQIYNLELRGLIPMPLFMLETTGHFSKSKRGSPITSSINVDSSSNNTHSMPQKRLSTKMENTLRNVEALLAR